ncbi:MAG TPA: NAD(P)-binding domain-containing protein [Planctomycetota bacterium]|nr:NAD(P)-binding domain-containing protein [Planctomycetota bacterium]
MATLAVLGTGLLGSGMVENLLAKGHRVRIWNRSPDKLAPLLAKGAVAAADPAAAARGAERVHLVLAEDAAVDAVVAALRPGLGDGVPLVDHSTNLPARVAARFAELRAHGVRYLPAPVFMSPQNAREASGLMLLSGPQADADALTAALSAMTGKLWHIGERPDLAALFKLAGNAVLVSLAGAMGDLLAMGRANSVSPEQLLSLFEVFKPGGAIPFIGQRVVKAGDGPPSFELTMARKDVRLMQEAAGKAQLVVLPALAAAMDRALARGLGHQDFAVFARTDR